MAQSYEVEIKSLLGARENADALIARMQDIDPTSIRTSQSKHLNHYFVGGELPTLQEAIAPLLSADAQKRFAEIVATAKDTSVRTRDKDGKILFIVKASVDDTTSSNGISRIELEEKVPLTLAELDQKILDAGFSYQAKWSREREEYSFKGAVVCIDKNAGYGYLAEFEKVVGDPALVDPARAEVVGLMAEAGVEELQQDRLARMFDHYNQHWAEYYGTDKVFVIE